MYTWRTNDEIEMQRMTKAGSFCMFQAKKHKSVKNVQDNYVLVFRSYN